MGEQGLFRGGGEFQRELRARVKAELTPRRLRAGAWRFSLKAATMLTWGIGSYLALVLWASEPWQFALLSVSLGFALAGIAFSIGHDANHGAAPGGRRVNDTLGLVFDLIGASSYVWKAKHNHAHHSFTNVVGADTDIEQMPLARLAPDQPRRRIHRWQHIYMWPLYGMYTIKHHLIGDIVPVVQGRSGMSRLERPRGWQLVLYVGGKVVFWGWALALPLLLHPWWGVLLCFLLVSWVLGVTLAVVFQLAHCVEEAEFTSVDALREGPRRDWALHQVETTVDFAPSSRLLRWYLGGLNFQVEHHLMPKVCHVHYARISPIVRELCEKHGVRHNVQPNMAFALRSHGRWLRRMGEAPVVPAAG
ncbi:MAG: acyl-CoA desaturase [Thermoleophilia bacterium]|jgi:linoleoyl-CoA desaturase|nr:acyl-CoA desaturase [Thermoleophilia bacterium]